MSNSHDDSVNIVNTSGGVGPLFGIDFWTRPVPIPQLGLTKFTPLGFHVPQAIKEKIWEGTFVDFSLLYKDTSNAVMARTPDQNNLQFVMEGNQLVIKKPGPLRKKLDSFGMWQSVFNTFMSIFVTKHLTRCAELLKYAEIIRTASIQYPGLGWRTYDEQFRLKQESDPGRSWGNLDTELWLTVAAVSTPFTSNYNVSWRATAHNNNGHNHVVQPPRPGLCFAFNSATGCHFGACRFAHSCSKCRRFGHGADSCCNAGQSRWANSPRAPPQSAKPGFREQLGSVQVAKSASQQAHKPNPEGALAKGINYSFRSRNSN